MAVNTHIFPDTDADANGVSMASDDKFTTFFLARHTITYTGITLTQFLTFNSIFISSLETCSFTGVFIERYHMFAFIFLIQ